MSFEEDASLFAMNSDFLEYLYGRYVKGDKSISQEWNNFFAKETESQSFSNAQSCSSDEDFSANVMQLIHFFRCYAHAFASLDPLGLTKIPDIDYHEYCSIQQSELDHVIDMNGKFGLNKIKISELVNSLKEIYCKNIGFEFMHVSSHEERDWLEDKIESRRNEISVEEKKVILQHLAESEGFEQFLHIKYPGYKRFSIEGGESSIVAIEKIISSALQLDFAEIIFGMAHRGRLNVLTKVMGKSYSAMLSEFQGKLAFPEELEVSGDVKYHLGYASDREMQNGKHLHLSLCPNPSHLESIDPVMMGKVRSRQDNVSSDNKSKFLAVMIHGTVLIYFQAPACHQLRQCGGRLL